VFVERRVEKAGPPAGMAHDVFISHSTRDKPVSDAVCAALENAGIRCWVAPRDVQPGRSFAGEITRAIQQSKAMVLIFSANSNNSSQVLREVQLAVDSQLHILQFRIEDVLLNDDLKYYLSTPHWLDAMTLPLESHLGRLSTSIKTLLGKPEAEPLASSAPPPEETSRSVVVPTVEQERAPLVSPGIPPAKPSPRNFWIPALVAAVVICGIVLGVILVRQSQRPKSESSPQKPARPIATAVGTSPPDPTPSATGTRMFTHNFDTATPIFKPLFGAAAMSVVNAYGEGRITGSAPGFLPAMSDIFLVDYILECRMRADNVPPGARYGFVFRAAAIENGVIPKFYALLLDPNEKIAEMRSCVGTRLIMNPEQSLPTGLLQVSLTNRVTLEVVGNRFRLFIDGKFGAEFSMEGLNEGRIGLCLLNKDSTAWTVHFDNLEIFLPPGK
jgi:hypothetical protein